MRNLHKQFTATHRSVSTERRLLHFSPDGFEGYIQRRKAEMQEHEERMPSYRKHSEKLAKQADAIAEGEMEDPYGGRAYAPEIDIDHSEDMAAIGIVDFDKAEQDMELSRNTREMIVQCKKLMLRYPDHPKKGIKGLKFRFDGANLSVVSGDPQYVAAAIDFLEARKVNYDDSRDIHVQRLPGENEEEFETRKVLARQAAERRAGYNAPFKAAELKKITTIVEALRSYRSEFRAHEAIRKDIVDDSNPPDKLREYERTQPDLIKKFKRERPMAYIQLLRDSAKRDPSILEGRETELVGNRDDPNAEQMHLFVRLIEETAETQPSAMRYYPDRLKRVDWWVAESEQGFAARDVGLSVYRKQMVRAVQKDADLYQQIVLPEYAQYWTRDIPKTQVNSMQEAKDIFGQVTAAAIGGNPDMFYEGEWREYMQFDTPSAYHDFVVQLPVDTKVGILNALRSEEQMATAFKTYEGGVIQFIDDLFDAAGYSPSPSVVNPGYDEDPFALRNTEALQSVVRAVVTKKTPNLLSMIKTQDTDLYEKISAVVQESDDQDMMALLGTDFEMDEDSAEAMLSRFLKDLQAPGSVSSEVLQKFKGKISALPEDVLKTPRYKAMLMKLVAERGELFGELPMEWRTDKDIALDAVFSNADAFAFVDVAPGEGLKNNLDIIFAAVLAEAAGRGRMTWTEQVGSDAKEKLAELGVEGVPDVKDVITVMHAKPQRFYDVAVQILKKNALIEFLQLPQISQNQVNAAAKQRNLAPAVVKLINEDKEEITKEAKVESPDSPKESEKKPKNTSEQKESSTVEPEPVPKMKNADELRQAFRDIVDSKGYMVGSEHVGAIDYVYLNHNGLRRCSIHIDSEKQRITKVEDHMHAGITLNISELGGKSFVQQVEHVMEWLSSTPKRLDELKKETQTVLGDDYSLKVEMRTNTSAVIHVADTFGDLGMIQVNPETREIEHVYDKGGVGIEVAAKNKKSSYNEQLQQAVKLMKQKLKENL